MFYQSSSSLSADIANPSSWSLSLLDATNWELQVISGEGESYGAEFQFQKDFGTTRGLVSYTYAKANRTIDNGNNETRRYHFDRRHDLKMAFNHRLFKWVDFSWSWIYGTGLSSLIPVLEFIIITPEGPVSLYEFEEIELAPNHRLDLGFNIFIEKKGIQHKWYAGIYNVYNRKNPQYYTFKEVPEEDFDPTNPKYDRQLIEGSVFPILPSVSYSIRF